MIGDLETEKSKKVKEIGGVNAEIDEKRQRLKTGLVGANGGVQSGLLKEIEDAIDAISKSKPSGKGTPKSGDNSGGKSSDLTKRWVELKQLIPEQGPREFPVDFDEDMLDAIHIDGNRQPLRLKPLRDLRNETEKHKREKQPKLEKESLKSEFKKDGENCENLEYLKHAETAINQLTPDTALTTILRQVLSDEDRHMAGIQNGYVDAGQEILNGRKATDGNEVSTGYQTKTAEHLAMINSEIRKFKIERRDAQLAGSLDASEDSKGTEESNERARSG